MAARWFVSMARLVLAGAAAVAGLLGPAHSAQAATDRHIILVSEFDQGCLTFKAEAGNTWLATENPCDLASYNVYWFPRDEGGDQEAIVMAGFDGQCLDQNSYQNVHVQPCNGGPWQTWIWSGHGAGVVLQNKATHLCLDNSSIGLRPFACNYSRYQQWNWKFTG